MALEENAFDSLNEGLRKYRAGLSGDSKAYKFAVQHIAHFLELYFKYQVFKLHPFLIYKTPSATGDVQSKITITADEAISILVRNGVSFPQQFRDDLKWFKRLRNDIEHSAFELNPKEVRRTIGQLFRATDEFVKASKIRAIRYAVSKDNQQDYDVLLDEFLTDVREAQVSIIEDKLVPMNCNLCHQDAVAIVGQDGAECRFCKKTDRWRWCVDCHQQFADSMTYMLSSEDDDVPDVFMCHECFDTQYGPIASHPVAS